MKSLIGFSLAVAASAANAQVLADSVAEFSGTQGQDGWNYGYSDRNSAGSTYDPASQFSLLPSYDGSRWHGVGTWVSVYSEWQHPNGTNSGGGDIWAIRRWTSDYAGLATIAGEVGHQSGNLTSTFASEIYINGALAYTFTPASGARVPYSITSTLAVGDKLDFIVRSTPSDLSNHARFTATVTQAVPEPATLAVLGLGGLALLRRRKVS